jgi:hypothetical protein
MLEFACYPWPVTKLLKAECLVLKLTSCCGYIRWDEVLDMPEGGLPQAKIGVGQWLPGITFGEFAERTVAGYYHAIA